MTFINSDPGLILLFLRFLDGAGIPRERLRYRVHIHETAELQAATRYWSELTEAEPHQFYRPNIKRGNPRTRRKNVGADYHGCLQIRVSKSCDLYRQIDGWAAGVMAAAASHS